MARIATLLVLFGVGCAAAAAPDPLEPETAALEIGTGTWRFEPLEDGDEIPMVHGAQGGWHLWVAVRTNGMEARIGRLEIELQPADESAPAQSTAIGISLDPPDAEGRMSYLGWPAILPNPSCAAGTMQRIRATFTTSSGERASSERYVIAAPGERPPPVCGR